MPTSVSRAPKKKKEQECGRLGPVSHMVLLACLPRCASVRNSANALAVANGRRRRSSSGTRTAVTAARLLSSKKTSQTVHQPQPLPLRHLHHSSSSHARSISRRSSVRPSLCSRSKGTPVQRSVNRWPCRSRQCVTGQSTTSRRRTSPMSLGADVRDAPMRL
jgi:hypothetical protein